MQIEATSASRKIYMDLLQEESSKEAKHWKAPQQKLFKLAYSANNNDMIQNKNDNGIGERLPQNYNCKQCLNIHNRKDTNEIACSKSLQKTNMQITTPVRENSISFLGLEKDNSITREQIQYDKQ